MQYRNSNNNKNNNIMVIFATLFLGMFIGLLVCILIITCIENIILEHGMSQIGRIATLVLSLIAGFITAYNLVN